MILSWRSWCQGVVTSSPPPIFQHVHNCFAFTFLFSFSFCFTAFIFVFIFYLFFAFNILLPKSSDHVTTSIFQHVRILSLSQHYIWGLSIFQDLWTLSLSQLFIRGNLTFQELCSPSLSSVMPNI